MAVKTCKILAKFINWSPTTLKRLRHTAKNAGCTQRHAATADQQYRRSQRIITLLRNSRLRAQCARVWRHCVGLVCRLYCLKTPFQASPTRNMPINRNISRDTDTVNAGDSAPSPHPSNTSTASGENLKVCPPLFRTGARQSGLEDTLKTFENATSTLLLRTEAHVMVFENRCILDATKLYPFMYRSRNRSCKEARMDC